MRQFLTALVLSPPYLERMLEPHSFAIGVLAGLPLGGLCLVAMNCLADWREDRRKHPGERVAER